LKQNWGKILLIVIPIVIAAAILYPTYNAGQLEDKRKDYLSTAESAADSLAQLDNFKASHGEDYESAKANQLKLGLDLKGGMYVTLEIDVLRLIEESAEREVRKDELFQDVLKATKEELEGTDLEVLPTFLEKFDEIARPKGKSLISYFDVGDFRDASEEKIIENLEQNTLDAIDQAQEVIRQRIDQYGVSEPNIQKVGSNRIILELPGVQDEEEMRKLIETTARLEVNLVRNDANLAKAFYRIDKFLYEQALREGKIEEIAAADASEEDANPLAGLDAEDALPGDTIAQVTEGDEMAADTALADTADTMASDTAAADTNDPFAGLSEDEVQEKYSNEHPFTRLFASFFQPLNMPNAQTQQVFYVSDQLPEGNYIFFISKDSIDKFREILSRPEIAPLIPADYKVALEAKPDERPSQDGGIIETYNIYGLKAEPELTGDVITDAIPSFDQVNNQPVVIMRMNTDGAERWARITGENIKKQVAIVLDDRVYSAPVVQSRITGGSSEISGMEDVEEANLLQIVLKAGALKAPVQIVEERVVGPSLGRDSINAGLNASLIAFALVILYMVLYYSRAGVIADFAVFTNVSLILAALASLGGTLTLPGIAGIILTIGMAVDANVLIFERIREEISKGTFAALGNRRRLQQSA
jgi:SecD/SecF fusion protein